MTTADVEGAIKDVRPGQILRLNLYQRRYCTCEDYGRGAYKILDIHPHTWAKTATTVRFRCVHCNRTWTRNFANDFPALPSAT